MRCPFPRIKHPLSDYFFFKILLIFWTLKNFALSNIFSTLEANSFRALESLPNSALGRSLGVLFIAEALGFKKALFL